METRIKDTAGQLLTDENINALVIEYATMHAVEKRCTLERDKPRVNLLDGARLMSRLMAMVPEADTCNVNHLYILGAVEDAITLYNLVHGNVKSENVQLYAGMLYMVCGAL